MYSSIHCSHRSLPASMFENAAALTSLSAYAAQRKAKEEQDDIQYPTIHIYQLENRKSLDCQIRLDRKKGVYSLVNYPRLSMSNSLSILS